MKTLRLPYSEIKFLAVALKILFTIVPGITALKGPLKALDIRLEVYNNRLTSSHSLSTIILELAGNRIPARSSRRISRAIRDCPCPASSLVGIPPTFTLALSTRLTEPLLGSQQV